MRGARVLLLAVLCVSAVCAADEVLPTSGEVSGTYHRNRWGVGRFKYFIVHPDLHSTLAPLEGRPATILVTDSTQPLPSLPPLMRAAGKVTPLPEPKVHLELRTIPARPAAGEPFQLCCLVRNRSRDNQAIVLDATYFRLLQPTSVDQPDAPCWLGPAYTQAQLAVARKLLCGGAMPLRTADGLYGNFCPAGTVLIPPGDCFPVAVMFHDALPAGEYEIEAAATYHQDDAAPQSSLAWLKLDIADTPSAPNAASGLQAAKQSVEAQGDQYAFSLRLAPPERSTTRSASARRIVQSGAGRDAAWVGNVRAFAADGSEISLAADASEPKTTVNWRLVAVPAEGLEVHGLFRPASRFEPRKIAKVTLEVLTDRGAEAFLLADKFSDTAWSSPPEPGEASDGVRLRIRPAAPGFRAGEPLAFHVQASNSSGRPVCWPQRSGVSDNVLIEIDGKAAEVEPRGDAYTAGWTAEWMCRHAEEWTLTLPGRLQLSPGKHTLRYILMGAGGSHATDDGDLVPMLSGKVMSNATTFVVK